MSLHKNSNIPADTKTDPPGTKVSNKKKVSSRSTRSEEAPLSLSYDQLIELEWLETNELGGWASGTIAGPNTRRYHGLLVAALTPPTTRVVLLSKLDETIVTPTERFELGANEYPGAVAPTGFFYLSRFSREIFPSFEYTCGQIRLSKTVIAWRGQNATILVYELLASPTPIYLELAPFAAGRGYHELTHANSAIHQNPVFHQSVLSINTYSPYPPVKIHVPDGEFIKNADWFYRFQYRIERERGLASEEDLFTPGVIKVPMKKGDKLHVVVSAGDYEGSVEEYLKLEKSRRSKLRGKESAEIQALRFAASQFVVKRGESGSTIIAGYPWFTDWGRDTMISLPGICNVLGRFDEARSILKTFASSVSEGMIPNRFPDNGESPEYNTADATLWFFVAIHSYLKFSGDRNFVCKEMLPVLLDILAWHERGTRFGIKEDSDGLLFAGVLGTQLTWMDVKVGEWAVTPRIGKPVEVNALWYNARMIMAELLELEGNSEKAKTVRAKANVTLKSFRSTYWNPDGGYLFDVVHGEEADSAIRPNQLFALSLPFPLLEKKAAKLVLSILEKELLTPRGLRTLSPSAPGYIGRYEGPPERRDSAYHQGTVWSWLLGPYVTAQSRFGLKSGKEKARKLFHDFLAHLSEVGIGTVSEIFDGDAPHYARGCFAQAWSVGELLRAYYEDLEE